MASHWYDPITGKLVLEVPTANGLGTKAPTLREARALGLLPSVTTILEVLAKPMLVDWIAEQHAKEGYASGLNRGIGMDWIGTGDTIPDPKSLEDIKLAASTYTRYASVFGSAVHSLISDGLNGRPLYAASPLGIKAMSIATEALTWIEANFKCEASEKSFVSEWAGTIDFLGTYHGQPVIADFKTREGLSEGKPNWYNEQALQLSGYALGIAEPERARVSILIDREVPGIIVMKSWDKKEKWDRQWKALWEYWKAEKEWNEKV